MCGCTRALAAIHLSSTATFGMRRLDVKPVVTLLPPLPLLPPPPLLLQGIKGTGYVDWLYLDKDLRVTRGSKGSLFVHLRDDEADV